MKVFNIYFLFIVNVIWLQNIVRSSKEASKHLDFLLENYDKLVRPNFGVKRVDIAVTLWITDVDMISEENMDYTIHMYFRQKWKDERLSNTTYSEPLRLPGSYSDKIWTPDTFFSNEKSSFPHTYADTNSFLRINPNGEIFLSTKRSITLTCHMDLRYFPMDTQHCLMIVESYGFTGYDVAYFWEKGDQNSMGINNDIHLTNFYISRTQVTADVFELSSGNYSRLEVKISFTRIISAYFFHVYIPAALIVLLSYVSLWLNANYCAHVRAIIGMTTTIAMILIIYNPFSSPTKSAYTKSLDIYIGFCFFMVIATFIQFGIVMYINQKRTINGEKQETMVMDDENNRLTRIIDKIEYFSKIGFLTFFVVIVIFYWIISYSLSKSE